MFELIKERLEALDPAGWELAEETVRSWEFYFIRHELDQNRAVETKEYQVKVYRELEDGQFLGSSSGVLSPGATIEEIDQLLQDLSFRAGYVKNPVYKLVDQPLTETEFGAPADLSAISSAFLKAMQEVKETPTEDVNSYEIFVKEIRRKFLNSNGVTYTCTYPSSMAEVVVNARKGDHEIEIYRNFTSGTCDGEKLRSEVEKAMKTGKDRLEAVDTPKALDGIDVVFSGNNAVDLYWYFADRMSASFQVHKLSDWKCGETILPEKHGDAISLEVVPELPNSSKNYPVDEEGSLIRQRFLVKDGVAAAWWGSRQMSQYLGLEDSSMACNLRVSGGTRSEEELRRDSYLEVAEFSDFQVDPVGGDIAGEIRLAYWYHDGQCTPVTGGSLSGSMNEVLASMQISANTEQFDTFIIPALTRVSGLKITGVA